MRASLLAGAFVTLALAGCTTPDAPDRDLGPGPGPPSGVSYAAGCILPEANATSRPHGRLALWSPMPEEFGPEGGLALAARVARVANVTPDFVVGADHFTHGTLREAGDGLWNVTAVRQEGGSTSFAVRNVTVQGTRAFVSAADAPTVFETGQGGVLRATGLHGGEAGCGGVERAEALLRRLGLPADNGSGWEVDPPHPQEVRVLERFGLDTLNGTGGLVVPCTCQRMVRMNPGFGLGHGPTFQVEGDRLVSLELWPQVDLDASEVLPAVQAEAEAVRQLREEGVTRAKVQWAELGWEPLRVRYHLSTDKGFAEQDAHTGRVEAHGAVTP